MIHNIANDPSNHLARLVYDKGLTTKLKEKNEKMEKRINYLVEANNELMKELEQCESEIVTVEKECYGRGVGL
jgi:chaperonin cofactor prefoldin